MLVGSDEVGEGEDGWVEAGVALPMRIADVVSDIKGRSSL